MMIWQARALGIFFCALFSGEYGLSNGKTSRYAWCLLGNFLCDMSNAVRSPNRKSPIQHSRKEREPIARVACHILPVSPDKVIRSVSSTELAAGHDSTDDNTDEEPDDNEERA